MKAIGPVLSDGMSRRTFLRLASASCALCLAPAWLSCRPEVACRVGDIPPGCTLEDLRGNRVSVPADFRGRVALVHFWASWCPNCRPEMASLEFLYGRHGGSAVIPCSISLGDTREAALSYTRNLGLTYPVLLDPQSSLVRAWRISGIPTTFVLDRDNVIRHRILGEIDRDAADRVIRSFL